MINGIDQNIENSCSSWSRFWCRREERLPLSAESNGEEAIRIAQKLTKNQILNDDTEDQ